MSVPSRRVGALIGRQPQLDELRAALRDAGTRGQLLAVHGPPGMGKTAVVQAALRTGAPDGHLVVRLHPQARGVQGLDGIVDQVCDTLVDDGRARDLVMALRRRQRQLATHDRSGPWLMTETLTTVVRAAGTRPMAVFLDDVHLVAQRDQVAVAAFLDGLRTAGACVVVCAVPTAVGPSAAGRVPGADRTMVLPPLTEAQSADLIHRCLAAPAARELVAAVRHRLGPVLAGIPGPVLRTVRALRDHDRLTTIDGHVHLDDPGTPIPVPGFRTELRGWLPRAEGSASADDRFPGEVLALLTRLTGVGETTVDDFLRLAGELGASQDELGGVLDTLAGCGLVAVDDRLRLTSTVPAELPPHWTEADVARLHARLVLNATAASRGHAPCPAPRLVAHALAAEDALPPRLRTDLLFAASGERQDPHRALGTCLGLLRQLSHDDIRLPAVLETALDLVLHHGSHADLLDLGARLLPPLSDAPDEKRRIFSRLASAWTLAVRHDQWLGASAPHRSSPAAQAARRTPGAAALLAVCTRSPDVPAGEQPGPDLITPPSAGEIELLSRAWSGDATGPGRHRTRLAGPGSGRERPDARSSRPGPGAHGDRSGDSGGLTEAEAALYEMRHALGWGNLASAWEALPGQRAPLFPKSPIHVHRDLVREYHTGSWDEALRLAGSLEAAPGATGHGPLYAHSRSIAAEICRIQGDLPRAEAWLGRIAPDAGCWPLLAWARMGVRHDRGDTEGAWRQGWRECRALRRSGRTAGLEIPLLRVFGLARRDDQEAIALAALEQLEELDSAGPSWLTRATVLLGRGLVRGDVERIAAAQGMLAAHGNRQHAFGTAVLLLRRTGERRWLDEAWRLQEGTSARPVRDALARLAVELELPLPRLSKRPAALSRLDLRVIEMVADGFTNRQLAAALTLSEKTIEAYLAKIFRRTGCRSRVELATAWLEGDLDRFTPLDRHSVP